MAGRRLTQQQQGRIQRLQDRRRHRSDQAIPEDEADLGPEQAGLAITNHGATVMVEDNEGRLQRCSVRQNLGRLACGDQVIWQVSGPAGGVVTAVVERRSLLTRPDFQGQPRPVAANLDAVVVVLAPEPNFSEDLIDRYLVAIAAIGVQGLLVLNKHDLLDEAALATV